MIRSLAILSLLAAACTPVQRGEVTRDAARSLVARVVLADYPSLAVEGATDCILANASAPEIRSLASNTVTGPTAATSQTVATILMRTETIQCLSARETSPAAR